MLKLIQTALHGHQGGKAKEEADDHVEDISEGNLSDIDPSSSGDEDNGESDSSSSTTSDEEPTEVTVASRPVVNGKEGGDTPRNSSSGSGSGGIAKLLRSEFGPRATLLRITSEEYLNERRRQRLVSKKGVVQVARTKVSSRRTRYMHDFFNTMLDIKWRYVLLIFSSSFFLSWLGFAVVWWVILIYRGDFEPEHLPDKQEENDWQPCVLAMYDFASVFLFSVETQHTIGYGSRQTTERCPEAIFMQSLQSVVGVMIQACMVGTIFAKLARPQKRTQTLQFSKNAVICSRDGVLCMLFRVANLRPSHLIETHVRAIVISKKITEEGEVIPFHQTELKVGVDIEGDEDTLLFIWPTIVVHRIDEESPFYHFSAKDFLKKHYEIIVVLEGIVEPTGMSIQARSSYIGDEILWGYRFTNVLHFHDGFYRIDYSSFDAVYKVDTPICSAKHLNELSKTNNHSKDSPRHNRSKSTPEVGREMDGAPSPPRLLGNHVPTMPLVQHQVRLVDSPSPRKPQHLPLMVMQRPATTSKTTTSTTAARPSSFPSSLTASSSNAAHEQHPTAITRRIP